MHYMGVAPRITNRERVLLALGDSPDFVDQYETPRRFSQVGLAQRLNMAQSHVSRALNTLIKEGMLLHKRKRVIGERRRVTTYSLSETGIDELHELVEEIQFADVLTLGNDGSLQQIKLEKLVEKWAKRAGQSYPDALSLAELLRGASIHDGLPLLESPPDVVEFDGDEDISSEAIGLHLELAELRRNQGDLSSALDHLNRAGKLHQKRGNPVGQVRCILAAASLGGIIDDPVAIIEIVTSIAEPTEKMDSCLMLHDALLSRHSDLASKLLEELPNGHPEVLLRQAELSLRLGNLVEIDEIPKLLPGAIGLRQILWSANYLRLQCKVANNTGSGWPIPSDVASTLESISNSSKQPHPLIYGELTLAQVKNPTIAKDEKIRLLKAAWEIQPPLPTIGHIGFQLASLLPSAEAMLILIELQHKFESVGDDSGSSVCTKKMESL